MPLYENEKEIQIVLADDHEIVRVGIKRLLSIDKSMRVVDEASNGVDAVSLIEYHNPDVALLDILMPRMSGIEATKIIKAEMPGVFIIMLTAFEDYKYIDQALSAGANGYLSKDISAHDLTHSIRIVLQGERVLSKSIIRVIQKKHHTEINHDTSPVVITRREQEILDLVAIGKTSPQIADDLYISVRTVESHRYNLMQKLGVKNTAGLVRYAVVHTDI